MFKRQDQNHEMPCDSEESSGAPRSSSQRAMGKSPSEEPLKAVSELNEAVKQQNIEAAKALPEGISPLLINAAPTTRQSILDLPVEVRKNIVGYEEMEMDEMLLRILADHTAATSADRIIMLLYTTYQRSPSRLKVLARLRHLEQAGSVKRGTGRSMYILARGEQTSNA